MHPIRRLLLVCAGLAALTLAFGFERGSEWFSAIGITIFVIRGLLRRRREKQLIAIAKGMIEDTTLPGLPPVAFIPSPEDQSRVVIVRRGEHGWLPHWTCFHWTRAMNLAMKLNQELGVTRAQALAMMAGVQVGWGSPTADPANWTGEWADGQPNVYTGPEIA
jgi:hypothetical protein